MRAMFCKGRMGVGPFSEISVGFLEDMGSESKEWMSKWLVAHGVDKKVVKYLSDYGCWRVPMV